MEYWIARWGGRPLIVKYGKYILITEADIARAEKWFDKYGQLTVFFMRLVPGVRGFIAIPAGIVKMNVLTFGILTFLASLPWTTLLAWGGYALGENYEVIGDWFRPFYIPIAVVIIVLVAFFLWKRIKTLRREQRS